MSTVGNSAHLTSLHGRESNVSKELGTGRGGEVKRGSVKVGVLLSNHIRVDLLEHFIESKLAKTLGRVSYRSRGPAQHKSLCSALGQSDFEAIPNGLVLLLVHLEPALYQVEGSDGCVGDATRENSPEGAESKVFLASELTAILLCGGRHQVSLANLQLVLLPQILSSNRYLSLALGSLHRIGKK